MKRKILLSGGAVLLFFSCHRNLDNVDCTTVNATYTNDILPLVKANCVSCHFANNTTGAPGDYNQYSYLKEVAENGKLEIKTIGQASMPPSGKLSMDDRKKIKCWIKNGAPNN